LSEKSKELEVKYQQFLEELSKERNKLEESLKAELPLLKKSLQNKISSL